MAELQTQKAKLRKEILEKRENLSKEEVSIESKKKVDSLREKFEDFLSQNKNDELIICAYYPLNNEIDLSYFYREILSGKYGNISLVFPRVLGKEMDFYEISSLEDLEKGCFSVMEPKKYCKKVESIENSFIIVPCVGINKEKARIGYGAGYYDKYFANKKSNYFVGITYDFATNLDFECEEFDIKMDTLA